MNCPPKKGVWGRVLARPTKKDACPTQPQTRLALPSTLLLPLTSPSASVGEPDCHTEFDRPTDTNWHTHSGFASFCWDFGSC